MEINMCIGGKKYDIDDGYYEDLEVFVSHARDSMTSPCMFHLLSHICDADEFKK